MKRLRVLAAATVIGVAAGALRRLRGATRERSEDMNANKELVRHEIEEIFNRGRLDLVEELYARAYVGHDPAAPGPIAGPEGMRALVAQYRDAFPDLQVTIEEQIGEGDRVVTRWTARGSHEGEFWGIPATGKQSTVTGVTISRVADGQVVESWTNWDALGLLQQLGAVTAPARA